MLKKFALSGNALKGIAALSMFLDHMGYLLFPQWACLRILGRLAFPIFAFLIGEGCYYTRNKLRYVGGIFSLGVLCQVVYALFGGGEGLNILFTLSLSVLLVCALMLAQEKGGATVVLFLGAILGVYLLNGYLPVDYGFWGCMVPVFANLFPNKSLPFRVGMFSLGLFAVALSLGGIQLFSLLAVPLLLLYSGKRGKWNMKAFFYIFYPAHLALLQLIQYVL